MKKDPILQKFIRDQGTRCPNCFGDIKGGFIDVDGLVARQPQRCLSCGAEWVAIYQLNTLNLLQVRTADTNEELSYPRAYTKGEVKRLL